jgi:hypothetical protein
LDPPTSIVSTIFAFSKSDYYSFRRNCCPMPFLIDNLLYCLILFQLPGKRGSGSGGWMIQSKLQVYFWLGSIKHKKNYPSGLPPGFQPTNELLNAERPGLPPPPTIHYSEKHVRSLGSHTISRFNAINCPCFIFSFSSFKSGPICIRPGH